MISDSILANHRYQAVFGPIVRGRSMELGIGNGSAKFMWDTEVEEWACNAEEDVVERSNHIGVSKLHHFILLTLFRKILFLT